MRQGLSVVLFPLDEPSPLARGLCGLVASVRVRNGLLARLGDFRCNPWEKTWP
jgi:hypothetical protein